MITEVLRAVSSQQQHGSFSNTLGSRSWHTFIHQFHGSRMNFPTKLLIDKSNHCYIDCLAMDEIAEIFATAPNECDQYQASLKSFTKRQRVERTPSYVYNERQTIITHLQIEIR